jgi:hypothetical protein
VADSKATGTKKAGTASKTPAAKAATPASKTPAAKTAKAAGPTGKAPAKPAGATAKAVAGKPAEAKPAGVKPVDVTAAVSKPVDSKPVDNELSDARTLLAFIEAQAESLKKAALDEIPLLKLSRAAAAVADVTEQDAPDAGSAAFLMAWKRTDHCNHFWGPTVGQERFCTKCQVPQSALDSVADAGPPRRRS